ncbi:hypothetical protein Taro_041971 [Colocasia esculenta]|uniref:Disease resistance protein At4g27190-like leucine-rich repeats domain-containing protein n=1 Tax=Colocasia esculenta TaxID=4460 RepID=A0A843WRF2_COLES|nr:hypothetical protein [Colocasia esculenta]
MGGWWWAGLQRLTSIAKLSLCGCPTTAELLFLSLVMHHHPHLPETLRELHIGECGCDNYEQELTTSSTCSSQLSPPPTLPSIPHNNVDASAGALRAFTSLKELSIWHSPNFLQKWGSCGLPSSLERLTIADDDSLSHEWLSACLHDLISLKALTLAHLENLQLLPNLSGVTSLESLEIESCPSMEMFEAMSLHSSLKTLTLIDCKDLRSLQNLSSLTSLETLLIQSCPSIQTLGLEVMSLHTSLKSLTLRGCKNLHSLPYLSSLPSLETLEISNCHSIKTLDLEVLSLHTSLKSLTLRHCKNLHTLPDGTTLPSLETLEISNCRSIEMLEVMSRHTSLKSLTLKDCKNLHSLTNWSSFFSLVLQRLPENLHSLVLPLNDLQAVYISECPSLESLPDTLSYFSSLQTLKISHCPSIQTWPTNGLPSSLQTLQIINCPALTGRFKDKPKSMCAEVAHIPCNNVKMRNVPTKLTQDVPCTPSVITTNLESEKNSAGSGIADANPPMHGSKRNNLLSS